MKMEKGLLQEAPKKSKMENGKGERGKGKQK